MALAALIVSILALFLAVAVGVRSELREGGRRKDELKPQLEVTVEGEIDRPRLRLRSNGPLAYDEITVRLMPPGAGEPDRIIALSCDDQVSSTVTLPRTEPGESQLIGTQVGNSEDRTTIWLRCTCRIGRWPRNRTWTVPVPCEIPGVPRISVW